METISFSREWKKRFGFTGAAILQYLVEREDGEWFPIPQINIQNDLMVSPSSINVARERLRAERVIDVRRVASSYEYRINHETLRDIEKGN